MRQLKAFAAETGKKISIAVAALFFALVTWTSFTRWANFEYRTFDLAYYVQAIWQLVHGRFEVSVEHVPLLGNHVEPIVFLFAPFFALFPHPMLFVVGQNAALAAMGPIGYRIARRLGFEPVASILLGASLLVAPAAGYIGLHEFHPEALTGPLLLLMLDARIARSLLRHWIWLIAVLACKENMALLIAAYCVVNLILERRESGAHLRAWYLWPLVVSLLWFVLCAKVVTPAFNAGNIDYVTLYDRLGNSGVDILRNGIIRPQLLGRALWQSLTHGNLVWGLLFPFLALPLLRPRWLVISAPILLQHLLSWRSSEWTIYFHYAAPLLPLFWVAAVETLAPGKRAMEGAAPSAPAATRTRRRVSLQGNYVSWLLIVASVIAQIWLGPAAAIGRQMADWSNERNNRARKNEFLQKIPSNASVVAGLPYLSHLAMREKLYSLHYILKGLKTLSHAAYEPPPPTDYVFIDYNDEATFDSGAGYYHPAMQTKDGRVIPSSDQLLHNFLKPARWDSEAVNELTLLRQNPDKPPDPEPIVRMSHDAWGRPNDQILETVRGLRLRDIAMKSDPLSASTLLTLDLIWTFAGEREVFPWLILRLTRSSDGRAVAITRGLCAPDKTGSVGLEHWLATNQANVPPGEYAAEALFFDRAKGSWMESTGQGNPATTLLFRPIPLGQIRVK